MRSSFLPPLAVALLALGASDTTEACASCSAVDAPPGFLRPLSATAPMSPGLDVMVEAALAEAARRTGLARAALQVVSAEDVTWADGSLGCPQSGANYTMALVPGYRIRIQAGAQLLDYHASTRGQLLLCPAGRSVDPTPLQTR